MLARVPKRLSITNGALYAGNERIADVSAIEQALVVPFPYFAVRLIAGRTRFELPVAQHLHARETVDAIGLGPANAPIRFRWRTRFAPLRGLVTILFGLCASSFVAWLSLPFGIVAYAFAMFAFVLVSSYRPRVEVGCDGVFVVNDSGKCFIPYAIARSVSDAGIRLTNGRLVSFGDMAVRGEHEGETLVSLVRERIEHALTLEPAKVDVVLVERLAASAADELDHIGVSYRQAACSDDDLWTVLEDGRSPPKARINAATLLLRRLGKQARQRIAAAAHPTIRPDVRGALEHLASS